MKEFFIRSILGFLFGMDSNHWKTAVDWVRKLASKEMTNAQRADEFLVNFSVWFPSFKPWVIETIRNLAVAFARKKGWIAP